MLEARHLTFSRGGNVLFKDLSFALGKGELLIVRGENGSGKSTLLRLIAGLIPSISGKLIWKGTPLRNKDLTDYQQNITYVGHKLALYPEAHLSEQINLWKNVSRETIEKSLENWGVADLTQRKITQLSQGQKKRISLSRCLWQERALWILDEPHQGLDKKGKIILEESIHSHLKYGGLVIMATHEDNIHHSQEILL